MGKILSIFRQKKHFLYFVLHMFTSAVINEMDDQKAFSSLKHMLHQATNFYKVQ